MVQEEISEFLNQSKSWKDSLVTYREKYSKAQKDLLGLASGISKEKLHDLEHFQNQFYIQLLNIHDVKKDVKRHIQELSTSQLAEDIKTSHSNLKQEYEELCASLEKVSDEFKNFTSQLA